MAYFLKYICKDVTCRRENGGRSRAWYKMVIGGVPTPRDAPTIECLVCSNQVSCSRIVKNMPKTGADYRSQTTQRLGPGYVRRTQHAKAKIKIAEQRAQAAEFSSLVGEDEERKEADDEVDVEWLPTAQFDPKMRLTKGSIGRTCRLVWPSNPARCKRQPGRQVTAGHYDLGNSRNTVMGKAINGTGELSAWKHAGRPMHTQDKYKSSEWCHLWADCLGGPTTVENLVSASYCANTEMLVIEHCIKGKADYSITVEADCDVAHVAEMIRYTVSHRSGASFSRNIDGRNDAFTLQDMNALQALLKQWMKKLA